MRCGTHTVREIRVQMQATLVAFSYVCRHEFVSRFNNSGLFGQRHCNVVSLERWRSLHLGAQRHCDDRS